MSQGYKDLTRSSPIIYIFRWHFCSVAQSCLTLCNPMNCSTPGLPVHHQCLSLPKFMSIESVPSIFPSIRVFSNESALRIRWPKYWSFSFNISPSNEHPGLVSFRKDWLDLLAVQGTLKSLLQHYSLKASILQCWAFFIVPTLTSIQDYWKNHSLDEMDLCWQSNVSTF